MKFTVYTRTHPFGNNFIPGHRYKDIYELEVGLNRIKLNATEWTKGKGFTTWYPFLFYWWPPNNQWFRWHILGFHRVAPPILGMSNN